MPVNVFVSGWRRTRPGCVRFRMENHMVFHTDFHTVLLFAFKHVFPALAQPSHLKRSLDFSLTF
jgi:hypothetical protein